VAFVCFYAALRHMPLADAVAVAFGSPFLVTALAGVVLKEPVGARRWLAIAVGFVGMLLVVRPGAAGLPPAALLVLASGVAYACMMVLARAMTRPGKPHENTLSFVFYMLVLGIFGNYGLAEAFRSAPVAVVAPFEYTGLLWAVLLGVVLFGDVPSPSFWAGAVLIVGSGLYTLRSA
jgi:drug/metabolite transporter (DMT)-like permease